MRIRVCDWCGKEGTNSNAICDIRVEITEEVCEDCRKLLDIERKRLIKYVKNPKK